MTNPNLASCVRAAVTVVGLALTIATGGAGAVVDAGVDAAADAATDAAADAATDAATDSAADATEDVTDETGEGTESGLNSLRDTFVFKQMYIGAAGGAVGNGVDSYEDHEVFQKSLGLWCWGCYWRSKQRQLP